MPSLRGVVSAVASWFRGRPAVPRRANAPRAHRPAARYDAAKTTDENKNHWSNADGFSANAANSPEVRRVLRNRSRYERANNGYYKGVIRGRTNDTVGTGPRLQLDFPDEYTDPDFQRPVPTGTPDLAGEDLSRAVERRWGEWCRATGYADKVRVLADAEDTDGEGFALFVSNPALPGVQLDLRVIECDRVTTPGVLQTALMVDGLELDAAGNPVAYHVLRQHPGDLLRLFTGVWAWDRVPAEQVVHLFEQERPEQVRGVPLMTPALPLYAIMRRYTLASLGAAELAAMIAGVIEDPNAPADPDAEAATTIEELDKVPFARNALLTLTGGKQAKAFKSEQPAPSYKEFKGEILTEAGRSAGEMRNTATGSSAEYNFSSGRLDHLPRQRGLEIRRDRYDRRVNDRVFRAWAAEAVLIPGYLPAGLPPVEEWRWKWQWDAFPSIDPVKDATAQEIRKRTGLSTDADELAAEGKDWREHYRQLARERRLRDELGLPQPDQTPAARPDPSADPAAMEEADA